MTEAWAYQLATMQQELAQHLNDAIKDHPEIQLPRAGARKAVFLRGTAQQLPSVIMVIGEWAQSLDLESRIKIIGNRRPIILYTDGEIISDNLVELESACLYAVLDFALGLGMNVQIVQFGSPHYLDRLESSDN